MDRATPPRPWGYGRQRAPGSFDPLTDAHGIAFEDPPTGDSGGARNADDQTLRSGFYTPEGLVGTPVLGVVNFPPRRIAGFRSECLVLGVLDPGDSGDVVLVRPDAQNTTGWRLG